MLLLLLFIVDLRFAFVNGRLTVETTVYILLTSDVNQGICL